MTLQIFDADPTHVTFTFSGDNHVTVDSVHVAQAFEHYVNPATTGRTILAGHPVDEADLTALMAAMRTAAGIGRCDKCANYSEPHSALCTPCAQELYDIRLEKRLDRARDYDS